MPPPDVDELSFTFAQLRLRSAPSPPTRPLPPPRRPPSVVRKGLNDLPSELLHLTCNYLDIVDLKSFRLTNTRFCDIGISHLFCEARLCADLTSLKRLENVATHPVAKYVKSLDCVGYEKDNGFGAELNRMADFQYGRRFILAATEGASYGDIMVLMQAWIKKCGYASETKDEPPRLSLILKLLVALESVKCSLNPPDTPLWTSGTGIRCPLGPAFYFFSGVLKACHLADVALKTLDVSHVHETILYELGTRRALRAFVKFMRFQQPASGYGIPSMLMNLPSLKLRVCSFCSSDPDTLRQARQMFADSLHNMPKLQILDLSFVDKPVFLSSILEESVWPDLESLSLSFVGIHESHFMSFLEKHTPSLKALELDNIILVGSSGKAILRPLRDWVLRSNLEFFSITGSLQEIESKHGVDENESAFQQYCSLADWKPNSNGINLEVLKYLTYGGRDLAHDAQASQVALTGVNDAIYESDDYVSEERTVFEGIRWP
ncbi:uncharacterized protein BDZ99DRAFT_527293 [Mytilinidion resinicola]|uniref:F-box domain-containing protein n=1 Tax=Mytilinidion resinicola TaxID=574789 RepID=A0A6A6Y451_9PEZI|nr:uncharacterized protein BDZ99DRAFT_527293 [Mytilinidion resinicola]KAF2802567.1 hypothetical protein BDZ99DRAFT_527293 [Mytilinidion resinicola]